MALAKTGRLLKHDFPVHGFWGNPKKALFKGASYKTQVHRLPTATRTCE